MARHEINNEQRLYVTITDGESVSCLAWDDAERKRRAIMKWLGFDSLPLDCILGTPEHLNAYHAAIDAAQRKNAATGAECDAELSPALRGLEGKRVEVVTPAGKKSRFYVGKSTGWMPIHLEIKRRDSSGGMAAYVPEGSTVRAIGAR